MANPDQSPFTPVSWNLLKSKDLAIPDKLFYAHLINLHGLARKRFQSTVKVQWTKWADWFGCSESTVKRSFDRLEKLGWVAVGDRVRGRSPRYRPLLDPQNMEKMSDRNGQSDSSENDQSDSSTSGYNNLFKKESLARPLTHESRDAEREKVNRFLREEGLVDDLKDLDFDLSLTNLKLIEEVMNRVDSDPIDVLRVCIEKVQQRRANGAIRRSPAALLASLLRSGISSNEISDWDYRHDRNE